MYSAVVQLCFYAILNKLQTGNLSPQNDKYERQKQALEAKVKSLENELERARDRLKSLRAQAEERV